MQISIRLVWNWSCGTKYSTNLEKVCDSSLQDVVLREMHSKAYCEGILVPPTSCIIQAVK